MLTIQEIAGIYSLGFSIGYFETIDIVEWADKNILKTESFDEIFIDLSLCSNKKKLDILKKIESLHDRVSVKSLEILTGLIARDFKEGNIEIELAVKFLDDLGYFHNNDHWPDILANTLSDRKKIESDLLKFFKPFEDSLKEWDNLKL